MDVWTLDYYISLENFWYTPPVTEDGIISPPILMQKEVEVCYENYSGDNDVLIFFDHISGFFKRLHRTIKLIVKIFVQVFKNMKYLLPWNSTVPRGEW